jgi:hypothetical protein
VLAHGIGQGLAGAGPQEADDTMVGVFQFPLIDVTVFIVDPESRFETIWKVVPEFWGEAPPPTLTGVGVTWLYGYQFEIKVIARLPL